MTQRSSRERLIDAGERLIAVRGPEVPLQEIAVAAGQRNKSAVQYYFGSREGLIEAIIADRLAPMEKERLALIARHEESGAPEDLTSLVRILVTPMLELPKSQGHTHYARCLEQIRTHPLILDRSRTDAADQPAVRILLGRLYRAMTGTPAARARRLLAMASAMFALVADEERERVEGGASDRRSQESAEDIVGMLAALLAAPTFDKE